MADLTFIHGLMGAGKSTRAINMVNAIRADGLCVRVLTGPSRTKGVLTDRSGRFVPAETFAEGTFLGWPGGYDVVVVDEAQFLTKHQVEDIAELSEIGVDVYCFGLLTDFRRQFFPGALELLRLATFTEQMFPPVCEHCKEVPAVVNARLIHGQVVKEGPQVLVGDVGAEYATMCADCWSR